MHAAATALATPRKSAWADLDHCAFCAAGSSIRGRMIASNSHAQAFLTIAPVVPGHTLITPIRCVATMEELQPFEVTAIFALQGALRPALERFFGAEAFNFAWNEGIIAGQTVPHFHLHMLPRRQGDIGVLGYDPRRFFYRTGERDPAPASDLSRLAARLSEELAPARLGRTEPPRSALHSLETTTTAATPTRTLRQEAQ